MNNCLTLEGRNAIVTGGSSGIGLAMVKGLADAGMNVAIFARSKERIQDAIKDSSNCKGKVIGIQCDVSFIDDINKALENANQILGSIDVVINSAGIIDISTIDNITEEQWDQVMNINLKGTFFMIQKSLPYLRQSKAARIINISSNAGRMGGFENGLAYTASKGGIISLTYGAARRLAPEGITVNCIAPGTIETEMTKDKYVGEIRERLLNRFPLGRLGQPNDVVAAACYFASEESGFTTGSVLDVNGGLFMG